MNLPERKAARLAEYDDSQPGACFMTICAREKRKSVSETVGGGALDAPESRLTQNRKIAEK